MYTKRYNQRPTEALRQAQHDNFNKFIWSGILTNLANLQNDFPNIVSIRKDLVYEYNRTFNEHRS
jgi:hypothetical protein